MTSDIQVTLREKIEFLIRLLDREGTHVRPSSNDFLNKQDNETVSKMMTVMYIGRGDSGFIDYPSFEAFGIFRSKELKVYQMTSKMPLPRYLADGLKYADDIGFDIDAWTTRDA